MELSEIEGGRLAERGSNPVDRGEDLRQVQEDLHRGRESHPRRARKITVGAPVRAGSVRREMPAVGAAVGGFAAEPNGSLMDAENQRLLPAIVRLQKTGPTYVDAVVGRVEGFDDLGRRIAAANLLHPLLSL